MSDFVKAPEGEASWECEICGWSAPVMVADGKVLAAGHKCLRDEFAMAAIEFFLTQERDARPAGSKATVDMLESAKKAYVVADAMLAARKEPVT